MIVNLKEQHCENFLQSLHKEQWQEVRLGEVAEIVNGYAFKSKEFLNIQQRDSLPIIKIKNVANGDVNLNDVVFYPYSKQLEKFLIKYGDILVSLTGNHPQAQSQVVGQISKYKYKQFALLNQRVAKIVTKDAEQDFLYYLLKTNKIHNILASHSSGSANQANISSKDIENLTIPLPPLTIQQKIAEILSSFDDKIDLLHRQNKTLESLALTLFRHYFIDNPNRNEWEEKPLSEIAEIGIGRTPPRKERHWFSTDSRDIKWISIKDMEEKIFIVNTSEFLTMEAIRKFRIPLIPPNTILLSFKMTLGRVSITTENMLSNEAIAHFNLYSEYRLFTEYLYCFLKTFKYETLGSTSSIVTAINSTLIKSINIRIPDRKIIVEFSMIAKGFFDKIYNNTKQIQNLQAMRDMMLGKIFN
ncbi:restriction endonuclease subunit S [Helicobacter winghamensis]|nr:restriction endonuclease subunit S [Helicobacter winghamensis]PKT77537.1 hypothetical protein BCM34_01140 [Helicobacter winghamensis]